MFVCARARARVLAYVCLRVYARVYARVLACVCLRAPACLPANLQARLVCVRVRLLACLCGLHACVRARLCICACAPLCAFLRA